jgi:hypothetical protein
MKRYFYPLLLALCALCSTSCNKVETYADMKEKEQNAISQFIMAQGIQVIDENAFIAQGCTTNTLLNQFVLLDRSGVYMQIVRPGCGSILEENKTVNLLCRFMEKNILTDSVLVRNDRPTLVYSSTYGYYDTSIYLDKMNVRRTGTSYTASFVSGMMYQYHGSASVPSGWLVPLNYVKVGRPENEGDEVAKVRLIVPHSQGTADATSSVYPCYYEITYEREK